MDRRTSQFKAARSQHSMESAEDYTELIADLIDSNGEARVGKIAEVLGISHVTALRTIRRLKDEGFVISKPRGPVELTAKGLQTARYCKERHNLLLRFFIEIGVPERSARNDVEGIEHHVSKSTFKAIQSYMKKEGML